MAIDPMMDTEHHAAVGRAVFTLWWKILPLSLLGVFTAEFAVMLLLDHMHLPRGRATNLVDAALLTALLLPGLYLVVLRPVGRMAARLAVASADARFRTVVESTGDALIVGDRGGRIRYANPAALALFGYTAEELEGAEVTVLVPEDLRERHRDGLRRFLETGETRLLGRGAVELEARTREGQRIPVELVLSAPGGEERGLLVGVIRDLRQRKRLGLYEALLPVCCMCGLIRDDTGTEHGKGTWGSLEGYVEQHASAQFSHTFCDECLQIYRQSQGGVLTNDRAGAAGGRPKSG